MMDTKGKNYQCFELGPLKDLRRVMLKENLGLTGTEVSVNRLPAGESLPFVHAHKKNEEVYLFIKGKGFFWMDGEAFEVREGTAVKVTPAGGRSLKADENEDLYYICIQAQEHSLTQATREDGIMLDVKVDW
jgi:mannose-6-phosphate isomerase-like protein (cupin superfamily)